MGVTAGVREVANHERGAWPSLGCDVQLHTEVVHVELHSRFRLDMAASMAGQVLRHFTAKTSLLGRNKVRSDGGGQEAAVPARWQRVMRRDVLLHTMTSVSLRP